MTNVSDALRNLDRDLHELFGNRLKSVVAYGSGVGANAPNATLAIVDRLTAEDLSQCAARVGAWHLAGVETPLLVAEDEFGRSLDAFPLEFGGILANHTLLSGIDPFQGLTVDRRDLRRACEIQARSHLLHLREGFVETEGHTVEIARLIARSAGPLAALVKSVARLLGEPSDGVEAAARSVERAGGLRIGSLTAVAALADGDSVAPERASDLFPAYLEAIGALANYIDRWTVNDR